MSDINHYLKELDQLLRQNNAEKLLSWFELVPEEHLSKVASRLASHIQRMCVYHNEYKTDLNTVFKSIEFFRPVTNFAVEWLVQLLVQHDEGLSKKNEHIAQACLMLLKVEYAMYGSMLKRAQKNQDDWQTIGLCIHRLMFTQIYVNVIRYLLYMAIPDKEWHNLHKLFILANQHKLTDFTLTDDQHFIADRISINNLYTFALLLGCAGLHQLPVKDILKACRCIVSWVSLVTVSRKSHNLNNEIVVDVASGSAPNFRRLFENDEESIFYYLHLEKLLESLETKNTSDDDVFNKTHLTEELKGHLINAWSLYREREERVAVEENVEATYGIDNIHYYLCGGKDLYEFLGDRAKLSIQFNEYDDIALMAKELDEDLWSHGLSDPAGHLVFGATPESFSFQRHFEFTENDDSHNHVRISVKIVDKSLHGCCIEFNDKIALNIQANEVIGFRDANANSHWQVGMVAWVRHIEGDVFHVGVRILSTEAVPLGVDIPVRLGLDENYVPGILLPYENTLRVNASILLAGDCFHEEESIQVSQRGLVKNLRITKNLLKSEQYNHFECGYYLVDEEVNGLVADVDLEMIDIDLDIDFNAE